MTQFDASKFSEDYFLRGKASGLSLYENYRWLPELTIPMAIVIRMFLDIKPHHTILDYGCARGYTVRAFRELGYEAYGVDCSDWAIENCDPTVAKYVGKSPTQSKYDWIISKDTLEHVKEPLLTAISLMGLARIGIFAVVPLAIDDGCSYVVEEYEKDVTHLHRFSLPTWASMFMKPGWEVTARYRVQGVKDNYGNFERGNGFLVSRRI